MVMETTTVAVRMTQDNSHLAQIYSKRSLALASIQTRSPGALTGWKKCLRSSVEFDLPAIPSKTAPIEEKEFRNMCRWVSPCFS